jgi:hypothetical protein
MLIKEYVVAKGYKSAVLPCAGNGEFIAMPGGA